MADSTTSSLNLSTESNQIGVEGASEIKNTNQATTEDGSLIPMDPQLYMDAANGDFNALKDINDLHVQLTSTKNTILHVAAQFGQANCVEGILEMRSCSSLLQQPNEKGDTPLHLAVREGHLTVVEKLIHAARDTERGGTTEMLRMTNKEKDTALHEAVRCYHPKVVRLLIKESIKIIYNSNAEGKTPLYIAAEWGFGDLVQMIIDDCTSPAHNGFKGRTALHAAVILNNQAMTKKILLWKSDLTKELDEDGWSPLHFAAYVGCDIKIVRQLLNQPDKGVVYLGIKADRNRTALHIAASRGHVDIVKVLVSNFPDCCEKVDDEGNNFLHLIMEKGAIFTTSGLSNIHRVRVKGLMNEKNVEGKTPLILFHNSYLSKSVKPSEMMFTLILDTLRLIGRRMPSSRVRIRPLGSLEINEDSDGNKSEEWEISDMKKTMENHMIVAALIATVTFAAGITLPGGHIQNGSNNEGMAVLSLPTNGTKGTDRHIAIAARKNFRVFVLTNSAAMVLSMIAIGIYFLASLPIKNNATVKLWLLYGYTLTLAAIVAMVIAFTSGLQAVVHPSSLLEDTTRFVILVFWVLFFVPVMLTYPLPLNRRWLLYCKKFESYKLM